MKISPLFLSLIVRAAQKEKPDDLLQVLRGPMVLWTSGVPASDTVNILWAFNIDGR